MSTLFNAGDLQRMDIERGLTEQSPRVPIVDEVEEEDPLDRVRDTMFASMLEILKEKYS